MAEYGILAVVVLTLVGANRLLSRYLDKVLDREKTEMMPSRTDLEIAKR